MSENKINNSNVTDYANIVNLQNKSVENINKDVYGTIEYDSVKDVTDEVSKLVSLYNNDGSSNVIAKLNKISRDFSSQEKSKLNQIRDTLENSRELAGMRNLFSSMNSKISKYEDLLLVTKLMPRLHKAKKSMVTSILSPDDLTKQLSMNITINDKPLSEYDNTLYTKIQNTLKKYKYVKEIKHIVDRSITFGNYYVAVLPYNKLYNDLIKNKEKIGKTINGRKLTENSKLKLYEASVSTIKDTFENDKGVINNIKNSISNTIINESAIGLFDESVLTDEIKKKSEELYTKGNKQSDGLLQKKEYKETNFGMDGCKIKRLDPRRLVKIAIDDTVFGYWYIETKELTNAVKNPGIFKFKSNLNSELKEDGVDTVYRSLSELLYKKLDANFVRKNIDIKDSLYDVLKYADAANRQLNVTFLEPEYVQEFEVDEGHSVFDQSLFYAKMWLMLFLSNLSAKVARSNDVRAYYVATDAQGRVDSMVMNAINTLKKNNRSFYSMTNLGKMISAFNKFDDLVIPKDSDDKHPIDFDIVQGQSVEMDLDILEMIEKIAVDVSGTPLTLIESSANEEFAKAYAVMNLDYMRNVLDRQIDLNPSNEEFVKKILKYDMNDSANDEEKNTIDALSISFQSPMTLLLTNTVDQVNNAKDLAQAMSDLVLGQNAEQENIDDFMLEVCKMYAPNVPWNKFQEIKDRIILENKVAKETNPSTEEA